MEAIAYVVLSRQSGLMNEMRIVANNIANASTTGYRQEGLVFSEFIDAAPDRSSLSMSRAGIANTSQNQGTLTPTSGMFDFAIEGDGFFMVETEDGPRLTRAGSFAPNAQGDLVDMNGNLVLDPGGAPLFVPGDASAISFAKDGTISADGNPIGQLGVFLPEDLAAISRQDGVLFKPGGEAFPVESPRVLQGFLEGSNVDPMLQMARLVEIQRGYELGQSFLEAEDQRIRSAIKALIR